MESTISRPFSAKVRGVVRLTRWKEYVPFVIPVTIFGALLALQPTKALPDWRLMIVIVANILVVAYAFMINDIEDAPDDAREAHRAARNPVCNGELSPREGWFASLLVALLTLAMYALAGLWPLIIGAITLALSHLYSWKPIRLKKWPVTDVVSHSLMLSGLLFLTGYFTYHTAPGAVWLVALAATFISCYGQLYNQLRDFDMDVAAGLRNTSILVGKRNAQFLMYASVAAAAALMIYALIVGIVPLWILAAPLLILPVVYFMRSKADLRGTVAIDFTGNVQIQFIVLANCTVLVWLAAVMLRLT